MVARHTAPVSPSADTRAWPLRAVAARRPLARSVFPDTVVWTVALVLGGSLLIALAAQVAFPLPWSPVPVTGQTFAILLVGACLGSRLGLAAVVAYLVEGAIGLPVFAPGGALGLARFTGPTAGYLVGFALAAFAVGWLAERGWDRRPTRTAVAMLAGEAVIYICGLLWLSRFVPGEGLLEAGLLPFIPGDLFKVALAALLLPAARRVAR